MVFLFVILVTCWPAVAQENVSSPSIDQLITAGEFPAALQKIEAMPAADADQWRVEIALRQIEAGAGDAAFFSLSSLQDANGFDGFNFNPQFGPNDNNNNGNQQLGQQGGITANDFQPLIDLIQSVIGTDTWQDTGGEGTLMAYPAGVYVDTSGILQRLQPLDANNKARRRTVKQKLAFDSRPRGTGTSPLRKISLKGLLREVNQATAFGRPLDRFVRNMAGVYKMLPGNPCCSWMTCWCV